MVFRWLMHKQMRKEAIRMAAQCKKLYPETRKRFPDATEGYVNLRMIFGDELWQEKPSLAARLEEWCATINGFCYTMALEYGSLKGLMNFRAIEFTDYMDEELERAGFPPISTEEKREVLSIMEFPQELIDRRYP